MVKIWLPLVVDYYNSCCVCAIEATNDRIEWFSYLSIFVLIATALWQLVYLRNFFSSKKLL
jgi:hypothetical protein